MKKIIIILLVLFTTQTYAFEIRSVSSHGIGNGLMLSSTDVVGIVNTGFHFDTVKMGVELGMFQNYQLEELHEYYLATFYSKNRFTIGFGFLQFGDPDFYTEKNIKLSFSYRKSNFIFGLNGSYKKHEFGENYESLSVKNFGMSAAYKHDIFILGAVLDNLNRSKYTSDTKAVPEKYHLYLEVLSKTRYQTFIIYDIYKHFDNSIGIGERIQVSDDLNFLFGFKTKPSVFTGGIEIKFSQSKVIYTVSHHPSLGLSHAVAFRFLK